MPPRKFATGGHKRRTLPPEQFTLEGEHITLSNAGEVAESGAEPKYEAWEETFTVRPVLPGGLVYDIATSVGVDDQGNLTYGRTAVMRFLHGAIIDADQGRFDQLMRDTDRVVELDDIGPVMLWIVGLNNAGRPTGPQSS